MTKKKAVLSCRDVLWYLAFCGFAINYMLRINLNLVIVAMVLPRPVMRMTTECNDDEQLYKALYNGSHKIGFVTPNSDHVNFDDRFAWSEYQQGLVLGAYYWMHWSLQLPGGLLARRYGTKLIYGLGNVITAILGFFIPWMTGYHIYALIFLRVLQGMASGVVWPSMHNMTAKWIPLNERSKFISAYLGSSVGAAITYPLCAAISDTFGWGAAFYVTSFLGVIWYGFWLYLIYDSPQEHPRISDDEKNYILENLGTSIDHDQLAIPWRSILTSGQVWITIVSHWGGGWGFLTLITQAPTYFNFIHGWDLKATGMISGIPHLIRMVFSYYYSILSDWLIRTNKMSLTNVRKLATFVATGLQGLFILLLGFSGCHPTLAIIFMMAGTVANGAISAGTLATFIDLSPNYASLLLGFCGMVVIGCGFISPLIVGILTESNQALSQWRLVFIIAAINSIVGSVAFLAYGTSEEQPWNTYGKLKKENDQEMQRLTATPFVKCEEGKKKVDGRNKNRKVTNE